MNSSASFSKRTFALALAGAIALSLAAPCCLAANSEEAQVSQSSATAEISDVLTVTLEFECIKNLFMNQYDVDIYLDGVLLENIEHGASVKIDLSLDAGVHEIAVCKEGDPSVDGKLAFTAEADARFVFSIYCRSSQIELEDITADKTAEELDELEAMLEDVFPQEYAQRVAIVAMTNCQATDVFAQDGCTYEPALFHPYSSESGFYLTIHDKGSWSAIGESTWRVENAIYKLEGYETYMKASMSLSKGADSTGDTVYTVFGVSKAMGALEDLQANNEDALYVENLEPSESTPFLTVHESLVSEERASEAEAEVGSVGWKDVVEEVTGIDYIPTLGEANALRSAESYLRFMAFSRTGLIGQLEFEGFSHEEAVYAVDHCDANWYEQAARSAQSYLDFMSFSRSGLIDQLLYEGYTYEEAEYGVTAVGY